MAGNKAEIMVGPVAVYHGTAGSTAALSVGFTDESGVAFAPGVELLPVKVGERLAVVKSIPIDHQAMLKMNLLQPNMTNLSRFLHGSTQTGTRLAVSPTDQTEKTCSVKLVGLNPDGLVRTLEMLYATPKIAGDIQMSARQLKMLPVEYEALGYGSELYSLQDGDGSEVVTLSSGVLTRVAGAGYHKVGGEGATSDALTSITGTGLTDGELLILQLKSESEPITLTHLDDTLELEGDANWAMTSLLDAIWLEYRATGTKFVEVQRFDYGGY